MSRTRSSLIVVVAALLLLSGCSKEAKKAKFLSSAKQYKQQGKLSEAAIQYRNAIKIDPDLAEARAGLGEVLLTQGQFVAAEAELRKSLERAPKNVHVLNLLAGIYLLAGRPNWASEKVQAALVVDPANVDARILSGQIQLATKHPQEAEKKFRDIVSKENNSRAWVGVAAARLAQNDVAGAEQGLRESLAASQRAPAMLMGLAAFLERHDRVPEAQQLMEEAQKKDPTNVSVLIPLAAFYARHGNQSLAEPILVTVRDRVSSTSANRILLANYYIATHRHPKAVEELNMLVKSDGPESPAAARLGDLLLDDNKVPEAEALIAQILAKNKKSVLVSYFRGRIKLIQGDGIGAAQQFDEAARYMPRTPSLYYYGGLALLAQNKPQEAKALFTKALGLDPASQKRSAWTPFITWLCSSVPNWSWSLMTKKQHWLMPTN